MSENNNRLNSRLNRPNRKKKKNTLLNVLIGIVLLLIIIVVVNIVTDKDTATTKEEDKTMISEDVISDEEDSDTSSDADVASVPAGQNAGQGETEEDEQEEDQATSVEESSKNDESESESESEGEVTEPSDDPNVEAVTINPTWKPIGTTQTGEHISSYDSKSVDWAEKVEALSYGSGLDSSNMFVKFLGNGGSPQKSIGTVTSKDGLEIYRISLEWIDGQGWKPTKKEKLDSLEDAS